MSCRSVTGNGTSVYNCSQTAIINATSISPRPQASVPPPPPAPSPSRLKPYRNSTSRPPYRNATSRSPASVPSPSPSPPPVSALQPRPQRLNISPSRDVGPNDMTDGQQKAIIGVAIGIAVLLVLLVLIIYSLKRRFRKKDKKNENIKAFLKSHDLLVPKQYSYWEIKKMTNSFVDKLGEGGFGGAYKGKLPDGRLVAVKVLNDSKSNGEDFINEVSSITRTSHVNIVSLLGFCYKPKRVLIYEYMSNGSLDKLIYDQGSSSSNFQLEWKMLYEIAIGIARGLEYLHRGCNMRILHFDIKPHNILLDENFCAKISDFGLAKLCKRDQSTVTVIGARGTRGYIAPEVCSNHFGRVSYKSDVYSYGMMVLEMVGRRKNLDPNISQSSKIYFPHYIYKHIEASTNLQFDGVKNEEEEEIAKKMIFVSLWCIQTNPSHRPSMSRVLEMLQGELQSLLLPPKPFLSSPPTSPQSSEALE